MHRTRNSEQKPRRISRGTSSSLGTTQCLKRLWRILGNTETSNLWITSRKSNHLLAEPNCHTTKWFLEKLLPIKMNKTSKNEQATVFRSIDIGNDQDSHLWVLAWLNRSKAWRQFWIIVHRYRWFYNLKSEYIYAELAEDVEKWFDTSNYKAERPLALSKEN